MITSGNIPNHEIFTLQWKQLRHKIQEGTAVFWTEKTEMTNVCWQLDRYRARHKTPRTSLSRGISSLRMTDSELFSTSEMLQPNGVCFVLDHRKKVKVRSSCSGHWPSVTWFISLDLSLVPFPSLSSCPFLFSPSVTILLPISPPPPLLFSISLSLSLSLSLFYSLSLSLSH